MGYLDGGSQDRQAGRQAGGAARLEHLVEALECLFGVALVGAGAPDDRILHLLLQNLLCLNARAAAAQTVLGILAAPHEALLCRIGGVSSWASWSPNRTYSTAMNCCQ